MAVRDFNGTTANIRTSIGACSISGAFTKWALVKRDTDTTWDTICAHFSSTTLRYAFEISDTDLLTQEITGSLDRSSTSTITAATGWVICAVTKATGTATPTLHICPLSTGTWVHQAGAGTQGNPAAAQDSIRWGEYNASDWFDGKFATAAQWNVALTDPQIEATYASGAGSTLALSTHAAGTPVGLWDFNQAATTDPVLDLTGNGADQSAITGTTVVAGDDPPGWTFGLGGPPQTVLPDADITTTGWTTTPLFSKINDSSDGSVITGALS